MERRWSERKPVSQEVLLQYPGLGMLRCQTRDISFDGAYIETGQVSVPSSVEIDLMFANPSEKTTEVVRLGAQVVRSYDGGVGVSFNDYYEDAYQYLWRIIVGD